MTLVPLRARSPGARDDHGSLPHAKASAVVFWVWGKFTILAVAGVIFGSGVVVAGVFYHATSATFAIAVTNPTDVWLCSASAHPETVEC